MRQNKETDKNFCASRGISGTLHPQSATVGVTSAFGAVQKWSALWKGR